MDRQFPTLNPRLGGQIGHLLESGYVFGAAIGIAGIINGIDPDENVAAAQNFSPGQCERQHDGIACRHIGDGNARVYTVDRHVDVGIGQRRATELRQPEIKYAMFNGTQRLGDALSRLQLGTVPLAIIERKAVTGESAAARDGKAGSGVQPAGKEDDGGIHGAGIYLKTADFWGVRACSCATIWPLGSNFCPEIPMLPRLNAIAAALLIPAFFAGSAHAADKVKVGFVSTLSGPGAGLGVDIRDGFNLAMKHLDGKLGNLPAEVLIADDQQNPDVAKQTADKFLKKDKVDFMTGIVFSNLMLAVGPTVFENKTFYISANAGPSQYAGEQCNPFFFNVAWQNDNLHEAVGKYVQDKGFKNVVIVTPNYPGGKDAVSGFKRYYKGKVADEVYTKLGQLDYAAELAQIRASKPDALFFFLPGGMGINFVKQFVAAGLSRDTQLFAPGFSADEDVIKAVGAPMMGMFNSTHWAHDMDNPENKRFVADFQKEYGRLPSLYASQGYDAALMMDGAVRDVKGKIEDKAALQKALEAKRFKSVRGDFKFNTNHYPVQNYYLRVIGKDAQGRVTNKTMGTIFTNHADAYVSQCKMK